MKTFKDFNEGIFSRKSPEEKQKEKMRETLSQLANKMAGKHAFSKGDQEKYNSTWIAYRKLNDGTPPKGPKPSVYYDSEKMDLWSHDKLEKAYHKKLGIK